MIIKVCGMRNAENIRAVEQLHPNMMGFICWKGSKRNLVDIPNYLPSLERVGVFVNPTLKHILEMTKKLRLNRIQLHGEESKSFCQEVHNELGLPITKTITVYSSKDMDSCNQYENIPFVDMLLFDTKCKTYGGSGMKFDWSILEHYTGTKPFLLAGGIGPNDVERVKEFRHSLFAGIDLNSQFEVSPGIKDIEKLRSFINQINIK